MKVLLVGKKAQFKMAGTGEVEEAREVVGLFVVVLYSFVLLPFLLQNTANKGSKEN